MKTIFKEGMTVYWGEMKGVVKSIEGAVTYPVTVCFSDIDRECSFTEDGRLYLNYPQVLSTTPYTLNGFSQVKPIEKDQVVYVRDQECGLWKMAYFSHYDKCGMARCFIDQCKSCQTTITSPWNFIETENPLL